MNVVIILAAGKGSRFGDSTPKQFQKLNGKRVVAHTVETFQNHPEIDYVIVVGHWSYMDECQATETDFVTPGGDTRHQSILNGFRCCPTSTTKILIHDAVRPFLSEKTISECLRKLDEVEVVDVCCRSDDTIVQVDDNRVAAVPPRSQMWRGQTPQGFTRSSLATILEAFDESECNREFTDTVGIAVELGFEVGMVESTPENMKITHPYDLFLAERILQYRTANIREPDVRGRRIVVFGGSGGIGSEVVKLLVDEGAFVYAPTHDEIDLLEPNWFQTFTADMAKYDSVVYCVGEIRTGRDLDDWFHMTALHVEPVITLMSRTHAYMPAGGNLVIVGSSSATKGRPQFPMYSASKAALVNLVEGFAPWLLEQGVRVNCVNPGLTNTRMVDSVGGGSGDSLDPEYVARAIVSYCMILETGQVVHVR